MRVTIIIWEELENSKAPPSLQPAGAGLKQTAIRGNADTHMLSEQLR